MLRTQSHQSLESRGEAARACRSLFSHSAEDDQNCLGRLPGEVRHFDQCIVLSMQVKRVPVTDSIPSGYEIVVNSIDRDGTGEGYDLDIARRISESVSLPVIASDGPAPSSTSTTASLRARRRRSSARCCTRAAPSLSARSRSSSASCSQRVTPCGRRSPQRSPDPATRFRPGPTEAHEAGPWAGHGVVE